MNARRPRGNILGALAGAGSISALRIAANAVLARILVPEDFGIAAASMAVVGLLTLLVEFGLGTALIQAKAVSSAQWNAAFTATSTVAVCSAVAAVASAGWVAHLLLDPGIKPAIMFLSLTILLRPFSLIPEAALQRELQVGTVVKIDFLSFAGGSFLVSLILAFAGAGVWSILIGFGAEAAARAALLLRAAALNITPTLKISPLGDIMRFGAGVTSGRLTNFVAMQGDYFVVSRLLGSAALGQYSRAFSLATLPANLVGQSILKVLLPLVAALRDRPKRMRGKFLTMITASTIIGLPASVIGAIHSDLIVRLALGENWGPSSSVLGVLFLGLCARVNYRLCEVVATAAGAVRALAVLQLVYAALVIGGTALGIWLDGLRGAALGVLFAMICHYSLMSRLACRCANLAPLRYLRTHMPGLSVAAIVALAHGVYEVTFPSGADQLEIRAISSLGTTVAALAIATLFHRKLLGRRGTVILARTSRDLRRKLRSS